MYYVLCNPYYALRTHSSRCTLCAMLCNYLTLCSFALHATIEQVSLRSKRSPSQRLQAAADSCQFARSRHAPPRAARLALACHAQEVREREEKWGNPIQTKKPLSIRGTIPVFPHAALSTAGMSSLTSAHKSLRFSCRNLIAPSTLSFSPTLRKRRKAQRWPRRTLLCSVLTFIY